MRRQAPNKAGCLSIGVHLISLSGKRRQNSVRFDECFFAANSIEWPPRNIVHGRRNAPRQREVKLIAPPAAAGSVLTFS